MMITEERRDYQIQASSFRILSQWTPAIGAVIVNVFSQCGFFVLIFRKLVPSFTNAYPLRKERKGCKRGRSSTAIAWNKLPIGKLSHRQKTTPKSTRLKIQNLKCQKER